MKNRRFSLRVRSYAAVAAVDYTFVYEIYEMFFSKKKEENIYLNLSSNLQFKKYDIKYKVCIICMHIIQNSINNYKFFTTVVFLR